MPINPSSELHMAGVKQWLLDAITQRVQRDFPGGPVAKNPPSNARDAGSILGQGT